MKHFITLLILLPVAAFAITREEWQPSPANRGDAHRTEQEWERFNFEQTTRTVTNTAAVVSQRDAKLAAAESKYIAALASIGANPQAADVDAQADALDAQFAAAGTQAEKVAILRLGLRLSTLRARIAELGGNPKEATGRTAETNTVTTIQVVPK